MQLLLYEWESYLQYDLKEVLKEKGIHFDCFSWKFADKNADEAFEDWFQKNMDASHYDAVFSVNYWPLLSKMAQKRNVRYIAWCYDNPLNVIGIEETLGNPVNTVFFFDRIQAKTYQDKGFDTVHYLPLGVNAERLKKLMLSSSDRQQYGSDVALVGSLYESRLGDIKAVMDEYAKGYVEAVMALQQDLYGCYLFDEVITDEFVAGINAHIKKQKPDTDFVLLKEALTFALASEVTRKERLMLLTLLARRCDTRLYSFQTSEILKGVSCHPPIDYVTQMPKVFAATKINLNPSLRCIQSGIPMRALDVMGAGGFLLSNYQPELQEYFVQEEEMVMYDSVPDAIEKALFYLEHDELRMQIAKKGCQKVQESFSMQERLKQIWELAGIN